MKRVGFVACSKTKLSHPAPAAALYASALFRKSLLAAIETNDVVYILSALHGVLPLHRVIAPYDVTLKKLPVEARGQWADRVGAQLPSLLNKGDIATFFCGEEYTRPLRRQLANLGCRVFEPLGRLSLGSRLRRLSILNREAELHDQLSMTKPLLRRLARIQKGGRVFSSIARGTSWPQRGIYIILEASSGANPEMTRVVRIGTHAVSAGSKSSLWSRLSTHRGTSEGGGSHRSSIFRSHVGKAIIAAETEPQWPSSWGEGQNAPKHVRDEERGLEQRVSAYIGSLRVLWLDVPDDPGPGSDRAFLERNLIAIYSRVGLLSPVLARDWLGAWSPEWRIASTGLWNLDHALAVAHASFPAVLEHYVDCTISGRSLSQTRIAPEGWNLSRKQDTKRQLGLFHSPGGLGEAD